MATTDGPPIAWGAVTIDCVDTDRVAAFWSTLLDTPLHPMAADRPGWRRLGPLVPGGPVLNFQPVAEPKAGKTCVHLDLWVTDLRAAIRRVLALGGRQMQDVQVLERGRIAVTADAEDNEFCLLAAPA